MYIIHTAGVFDLTNEALLNQSQYIRILCFIFSLNTDSTVLLEYLKINNYDDRFIRVYPIIHNPIETCWGG